MSRDNSKDYLEVANILVMGYPISCKEKNSEDAISSTIEILKNAARTNPQHMLQNIHDVVEVKIDGMIPLALAVFTACAEEGFLDKKSGTICSILGVYGPSELLVYIELLKSKVFGRGFGSRPQKWMRSVIEAWSPNMIDKYAGKYPIALYSLLRLVHPRLYGVRGERIKRFLVSVKSK